MRIETLTYHNVETQGARRRAWLREHSPQHLQHCAALIHSALEKREPGVSPGTLVLGAGACTEIPLEELARHSDEVALADLDLASMRQAWEELPSFALRRRVRLLECDLTGGVSANLRHLLARQQWDARIAQGARTVFDAAANCLEQCPIADPPQLDTLGAGEFTITYRVVLKQIFPRVLNCIRLNLKAVMLFLFAGEMIASTDGLAYRIALLRRHMGMDTILPYVLWVALLLFLVDLGMSTINKTLHPWFREA